MLAQMLALALSASPGSFPLPAEKGQAQVDPAAKTFHVPHQLSYVERFYREQFKGEPGVTFHRVPEGIAIKNARKGDTWTKAMLRDEAGTTTIVVTPVLVMDDTHVPGSARPLVQLIVPRSEEVQQQLKQIDQEHGPEH